MIAEVIVDILNSDVDKIYDYKIPEELNVQAGQRVAVPFGNRKIEGYVINIKENSALAPEKLKTVIKTLDAQALLNQKALGLCFYLKEKFFLRMADCIRLFLPPAVRRGSEKIINVVSLTENCDISKLKTNANKQKQAVLYLQGQGTENLTILNNKFGSAAVKKLRELNFIAVKTQKVARAPANNFTVQKKNITLTPAQNECANRILSEGGKTFLLHGVTGSGKTEVYMKVITELLKQGKTAVFLVPEIGLTPQMLARFKNEFGDTVAVLHSMLSAGERYDEWYRLKNGQAKIAIGARSCIFAPLDNIGVIVIDEEHDGSYFSENNPRYYTHDVAQYLAHLHNAKVILGSATPSIESYYKCEQGEYILLQLPDRINNKKLPDIEIADMLNEIRSGNTGIFSNYFLSELEKCIKAKKQAMLFINRRGYASFMMCKNCGYVAKCKDCDVSLVYHKEENMLKCHYCDKRYKALTKCPECGSDQIRGGAVGTQRVAEELKKLFPDVLILRLDNDTAKQRGSYVNILETFNNTTPAILVGTQMLAKGHDFNNVTLVGIIDADLSLNFSDFRASERTFQLITQVAGRAGRSEHEGRVILQTYFKNHFVYKFASGYNYKGFYKKEIALRELTKFPPFAKILRLLIMGENDDKTVDVVRQLNEKLQVLKAQYKTDFIYLQAMKCPKKRLQNKFRYQILMRIYNKNETEIVKQIHEICGTIETRGVSVFIESNPQNLS